MTSQHSFYTNALFASLYYDYDESLIIFISHLDNSITDDGSNFEKFLIMNYEVLLAPALIKKIELSGQAYFKNLRLPSRIRAGGFVENNKKLMHN